MSRNCRFAALALGLVLLATAPARAQEKSPASAPELPMWERSLYKTLTYQSVSNIADFALYGAVLGGSAATGAGFVAVNVASAVALYYSYEYVWETMVPPTQDKTFPDVAEKAGYYRALAVAKNFALGYAFGGSVSLAGSFVALGSVTDTAIYVANEYAWDLFRPRELEQEGLTPSSLAVKRGRN